MKWIGFLLTVLVLTSCATPLAVYKISSIDSSQKTFALMNETRWNVKIRRSLAKHGFHVKRFSTLKEIEVDKGVRKETFNLAEVRYGITVVPGQIVDWCPGGRARKYADFTLEVTDLKTNEIVIIVEQGGWTDTCAGLFGGLFDDLAEALKLNWK